MTWCSMIRDLLTPENHRNPHHWGATALAHGFICQLLVLIGMFAVEPPLSVIAVSLVYLVAWEGVQLYTALRRGDNPSLALWDGLLDAVAVTLGALTVAFAAMGLLGLACGSSASLLIISAVGYWRRS